MSEELVLCVQIEHMHDRAYKNVQPAQCAGEVVCDEIIFQQSGGFWVGGAVSSATIATRQSYSRDTTCVPRFLSTLGGRGESGTSSIFAIAYHLLHCVGFQLACQAFVYVVVRRGRSTALYRRSLRMLDSSNVEIEPTVKCLLIDR